MSADIVEDEEGGRFDPNDSPRLLKDGTYRCRYAFYETRQAFGTGTPKVVLTFTVVEPHECEGIPIQRFYNVSRLTSEPKRGGGFVPPRTGGLVREMERLFGGATRRDRLWIGKYFRSRDWLVIVRTVSVDFKRLPLPEASRYSVIGTIVGPAPHTHTRLNNPSSVPISIPSQPVLDDLPF